MPTEYSTAYKKLSPLYNVPFTDIRKHHIQGVIDSCDTGWQSKSHMKSLCSMIFKYAVDMEIVQTNYASFVELPPKIDSEIQQPFTAEELQILWQNADDSLLHRFTPH